MNTYPDINTLRCGLVEQMKKQRLTQQDVSKATGIQQSSISMFLARKRGLNGASTLKLQSFLVGDPFIRPDSKNA